MAKAIFHLKENRVPVFKPKRSVTLAVVVPINKKIRQIKKR